MLEVRNLTVTAGLAQGQLRLLKSLSFSVASGERLGVVGESGSGKSMTALALLGLLPKNCAATGELLLEGKNLLTLPEKALTALRGRELVLIPQSGADSLNPALTVGTQLGETLRRLDIRGKAACRQRSMELLAAVGLDGEALLGRYAFQLSGGQAQRVVMAMGMAGDARLVIADEPTRGVDEKTARAFMGGMAKSFPHAALLIITHDLTVAAACERLLVLREGEALEYGDTDQILKAPAHPYTRRLLAALPQNGLQLPSAKDAGEVSP